jgi:hypothetical protein
VLLVAPPFYCRRCLGLEGRYLLSLESLALASERRQSVFLSGALVAEFDSSLTVL